MTEARQEDAWNHTASLMALLFNANRDPTKTRAVDADSFHPFAKRHRRREQRTAPKAGINVLKIFLPKEVRDGHDEDQDDVLRPREGNAGG